MTNGVVIADINGSLIKENKHQNCHFDVRRSHITVIVLKLTSIMWFFLKSRKTIECEISQSLKKAHFEMTKGVVIADINGSLKKKINTKIVTSTLGEVALQW